MASTIVFGATLVVFASLIYQSTKQAEFAKIDARLETHCEKLETEIEEQLDEDVFPHVADFNEVVTEGLQVVMVQIWDSTGQRIVSDSLLQLSADGQWQSRYRKAVESMNLSAKAQSYRCRWFPVEIEEQVPFVLEVATPLTGVNEILSDLRSLFLITIPCALLFTALAAYLITRAAFRPLTGMADAAQRISGSNLHQRLEIPTTKDEVQSLAETLNHMIERIDVAFRSQRQFVADASHEIRTPLTIINSELEYAQKATSDPVVQESLRVSLLETDRLTRMAESLLLLARLDSSQAHVSPKEFRLDEVVIETVSHMRRPAMAKHITVDLYVQDVVEIIADRDMIKRAILNVLENACKYSPPGTTVSVALRNENASPNTAILEIIDQGPGIPQAEHARVFERFYRSPEARSESNGSGLGLAIAKMLVELNGGTIRLFSVAKEGTRVTIEMPLIKA